MRIYIAGPCFTSAELAFNKLLATELRSKGHVVELPQEFVQTHLDIREQCLDRMAICDIMIAILDGADVDSGTAYEVGWWQHMYHDEDGTWTIGFRSDIRRGGDDHKNVNAMLSYMPIYKQITELLDAVDQL